MAENLLVILGGFGMDEMKKKTILQLGNLIIPIASAIVMGVLTMNIDATGVFSDSAYPKLLSPAPFTFAIWGPIFIFLALFYFYQARDLTKKADEKIEMPYVHEVSVFFMLSVIATSAWYVLWAYDYIWPAIAAMWAYLICNLIAYLRLGINLRERSLKEHIYVTVGWSLVTAWITVATIVNTTTGLVASGFDPAPIGESGWTVIVLAVALVIFLLMLFRRNDFIYAGVGVWSLIGVIATRIDPANVQALDVTITAILGVVVLAIAMIFWFIYLTRKGTISFIEKIRNR